MKSAGRTRHFGLPLATVAALLLAGCSGAVSSRPLPTFEPVERGATVAFVGDSIVHGYGLGESVAWPALVSEAFGWTAVNLGCDGGGFVARGSCGAAIGSRGAEVAKTEPAVIVISASRNDLRYDEADVVAAIPAAVAAVAADAPDARIIGVSAVWGPTERPSALDSYNTALAAAVIGVGGEFLAYQDPLRGSDELMLSDGIHPSAAGQAEIAAAFESAAIRAGLTP
ncbi:SGNH/GDSL hydrolase family protein [Microbacteriaceae bacterium VKM Ac-2854]|nr:SGNH/GDSL hydrolase family protein [Microbacteriaceae bacterium VKM Ac-2854]